jgi:hypothetical protein
MRAFSRLCFLVAALGLSACASVPMAPEGQNAYAKTFAPPPPDRAHIYVYRNEGFGAAVKMDLKLDGMPAGATVAKTFTLLPVRPGIHKLTSEAENTSELLLNTGPGQVFFVWQEVKMGVLYARNKLQQVGPDVGMRGVAECGLIAYPPPPMPQPVLVPPPTYPPPGQPSVPPAGPGPAPIVSPAPPTS